MLGAVEPAFSGIGGGGFALVHLSSGETTALDYRETAPGHSSADMFVRNPPDANSVGALAIATPGALAGHARLLDEFGTMRFAQVAQYAIDAAKTGVPANSSSRTILQENRMRTLDKVKRFPDSARLLGVDRGTALLGKLPSFSESLTKLAMAGPESFYKGDFPAAISEPVRRLGGILSEDDFWMYAPKTRTPVEGEVRGLGVLSMPPPSAGGTLLIQGLMIMEELEGRRHSATQAEKSSLVASVLTSILEQRRDFGDPDFVDVNPDRVLSGPAIQNLADKIRFGREGMGKSSIPAGSGSTSHFCVVDRAGNVVSTTETIECYFGSGVVSPDVGIILNDEMHDFETTPGKPNSVAPRKRPASSMSPTILLDEGSPFIVLGGAGSQRIISSIFQVITNVLDRKMGLAEALAYPRLHPTSEGLMVEGGFDEAAIPELTRLSGSIKRTDRLDLFFGGVQAAMVDKRKKKVTGCADPRRLGAAVSV